MVLPRGLSCSAALNGSTCFVLVLKYFTKTLRPLPPRARTPCDQTSSGRGSQALSDVHNKTGRNKSYILFYGTPKGIRTPAASVKGMCPRPLDDGSLLFASLSATFFILPNKFLLSTTFLKNAREKIPRAINYISLVSKSISSNEAYTA